jgi:hypothetical protein
MGFVCLFVCLFICLTFSREAFVAMQIFHKVPCFEEYCWPYQPSSIYGYGHYDQIMDEPQLS